MANKKPFKMRFGPDFANNRGINCINPLDPTDVANRRWVEQQIAAASRLRGFYTPDIDSFGTDDPDLSQETGATTSTGDFWRVDAVGVPTRGPYTHLNLSAGDVLTARRGSGSVNAETITPAAPTGLLPNDAFFWQPVDPAYSGRGRRLAFEVITDGAGQVTAFNRINQGGEYEVGDILNSVIENTVPNVVSTIGALVPAVFQLAPDEVYYNVTVTGGSGAGFAVVLLTDGTGQGIANLRIVRRGINYTAGDILTLAVEGIVVGTVEVLTTFTGAADVPVQVEITGTGVGIQWALTPSTGLSDEEADFRYIRRDGNNSPVADISWNGNNIKDLGLPIDEGDAMSLDATRIDTGIRAFSATLLKDSWYKLGTVINSNTVSEFTVWTTVTGPGSGSFRFTVNSRFNGNDPLVKVRDVSRNQPGIVAIGLVWNDTINRLEVYLKTTAEGTSDVTLEGRLAMQSRIAKSSQFQLDIQGPEVGVTTDLITGVMSEADKATGYTKPLASSANGSYIVIGEVSRYFTGTIYVSNDDTKNQQMMIQILANNTWDNTLMNVYVSATDSEGGFQFDQVILSSEFNSSDTANLVLKRGRFGNDSNLDVRWVGGGLGRSSGDIPLFAWPNTLESTSSIPDTRRESVTLEPLAAEGNLTKIKGVNDMVNTKFVYLNNISITSGSRYRLIKLPREFCSGLVQIQFNRANGTIWSMAAFITSAEEGKGGTSWSINVVSGDLVGSSNPCFDKIRLVRDANAVFVELRAVGNFSISFGTVTYRYTTYAYETGQPILFSPTWPEGTTGTIKANAEARYIEPITEMLRPSVFAVSYNTNADFTVGAGGGTVDFRTDANWVETLYDPDASFQVSNDRVRVNRDGLMVITFSGRSRDGRRIQCRFTGFNGQETSTGQPTNSFCTISQGRRLTENEEAWFANPGTGGSVWNRMSLKFEFYPAV